MRAFGPLCQYIRDQTLDRVSKCVSSYSDRTTFLVDAPVVSRLVLRATRIRAVRSPVPLRSFAPASRFPVGQDNGPSSLVSHSPGIAVIDILFRVVAIIRAVDFHRPYNYESTVPYVITVSACCSTSLFLSATWVFSFILIGVSISDA